MKLPNPSPNQVGQILADLMCQDRRVLATSARIKAERPGWTSIVNYLVSQGARQQAEGLLLCLQIMERLYLEEESCSSPK